MRIPALLSPLLLVLLAAAAPVSGYKVVQSWPHDPTAFTQGLFFADGTLWESTGVEGRSAVRELRLGELRPRRAAPSLDGRHFGEGSTALGDRIYQLTWQSGRVFLWDRRTLAPLGSLAYRGEGWGLTHDGRQLIMSDGSADLVFRDPATFNEVGRITVRDGDRPVDRLNELEYVRGEVLANVWQTDRIARIDPRTGRVLGWIDLAGLQAPAERSGNPDDVLNGIAWDAKRDRLIVTGKRWPRLYQIRLTAPLQGQD